MALGPTDDHDAAYAQRLVELQQTWWKCLLNVQAPYRWNLRHLKPGFTLDVGYGIGRNLKNLDGNGVGVEVNEYAVQIARNRGFIAFNPKAFGASAYCRPRTFDSLLLSHVIEHMTFDEAVSLIASYVEYIRPEGKIIIETPQERGYLSDSTHVEFTDFDAINSLCERFRATVERKYSFPLPRAFGRLFVYNEFVVAARLPAMRNEL